MKNIRKIKNLELSWREGVYLDPMSIIHFIAGILTYYIFFVIFELSLLQSLLITFAGAFLWEVFEISINVIEKFVNRVVDVALPIIAFFMFHNFVSLEDRQLVFSISLSLFIILWITGGYYYIRHKQGM